MPLEPGEILAAYIFGGPAAGPGGCMTTMAFSHVVVEPPGDIAEEYYTIFEEEVLPGLCSSVTLEEVRLRIGTSEGEIVASFFGSTTGGESGAGQPPNCSYPVNKFTALGGRANKGRMFLPGVLETHVDPSGAIDGAVINGFNESLANWKSRMDADTDSTTILVHSNSDPSTEVIALVMGNKIFSRPTRLRS